MLDKIIINNLIEDYNKSKNSKIKLHEMKENLFIVKSSDIKNGKDLFEDLLAHMKNEMKIDLKIAGIKKQAKSHMAEFATELNTADEIIRILDRYYEGTPPRAPEADD